MRTVIALVALLLAVNAFKMVPQIDTPQECIEKNCPTEWSACTKDPKCGPALDDCNKKCGSK